MRRVYRMIEKTGPRNYSVLILGESGTGKELVARAVHFSSPRKNRPFTMKRCVLPYVPLYNGASRPVTLPASPTLPLRETQLRNFRRI